MKKLIIAACLLAMMLSGCATIVGSGTQTVTINSQPSDAKITITDEIGHSVYVGSTPTSVTLQKSNGHYWGKKSYTITFSKKGYKDQSVKLTEHANGWYIGGNLVFGGIIGWFVVDPFSGAMYTLSTTDINASLKSTVAQNMKKNGGLTVLLTKDVPASLRSKLKLIHMPSNS
ncbi:MAG: hypothetical protein CENE_00549 [Candidatus Celerinatantimonas neptuna]|nr:MAG: hypothetical protein CENE_00549 [Candidatus Celerinatantimonas neptuna]